MILWLNWICDYVVVFVAFVLLTANKRNGTEPEGKKHNTQMHTMN